MARRGSSPGSTTRRGWRPQTNFDAGRITASGLIATGADPAQVKAWLDAFHLHLLSQDREQDDDVVLEVLDELVGF